MKGFLHHLVGAVVVLAVAPTILIPQGWSCAQECNSVQRAEAYMQH